MIAFTGTEGFEEIGLPELLPDLLTDLFLAVTSNSPQDLSAETPTVEHGESFTRSVGHESKAKSPRSRTRYRRSGTAK